MARKNTSADVPAEGGKQKKPKKVRWYHQVHQVYKLTVQHDPATRWWILGWAAIVLAVAVVVGLLINQLIYLVIVGLPFAVLAGMFVLARRAEKVQYGLLDGQKGASRAVLNTIRRGWSFPEEPVAMDPKTQDLVFRGVGRPGVVLITEGPAKRVERMVDKEQRRLQRILPGVPVTVIQVGHEEGQVPVAKLVRTVQKLKPKLTKAELGEVNKRLMALGQMRLPIPKGVDPMRARPDRRGMR
ncbi:DUF4191 domain-containing protein [Jonesia quinghaiensis]|uniref:DUF4191 domain-containing protein n=1 Tax=Jonesia quinghaiensis TaxID=262806 RepID=UPI0004063911|nr:DUF4191 domain-containing protein [Jonesia quinghaiensis]